MWRWSSRLAWIPLIFASIGLLAWASLVAFGFRPLVVMSGSMEPTLGVGDIAVVKVISPAYARPGEVVSFNDPSRDLEVVTHRVVHRTIGANDVTFVTQGDANTGTETWTVPGDGAIGRLSFRVPVIGHAIVALGHPAARAALLWVALLVGTAVGITSIRRLTSNGRGASGSVTTILAAFVGVALGAGALPHTLGAFSASSSNPGNTFSAAPAFCTSQLVTVQASADASVKEAGPTNNFGAENDLFIKSKTGDNKRAFIGFGLPTPPPGCNLTGATLRMSENTAQGTRLMEIWRVSGAWTESSVTWATQPAVTGTPVSVVNAVDWRLWPVTSMVSAMYGGTNNGFMLRDSIENDGSNESKFDSRNNTQTAPELILSFGSGSPCGTLGVQRVTASADASVKELNPTTNYGTENALFIKSKVGDNKRVLVGFTLPALGACSVTAATLRMFELTVQGTRTIEVSRLSGTWTEGSVTWAGQPPSAGSPVGVSNASGWRAWPVGPMVKTMYAGSNNGFLVRDQVEGSTEENQFASRNDTSQGPELWIGFQSP